MKTLRQAFLFGMVGFFGTLVNGIVYALLSLVPVFNLVPLPWFIFNSISWAWGFGIIAGFIFNFIFDKRLVFKDEKD